MKIIKLDEVSIEIIIKVLRNASLEKLQLKADGWNGIDVHDETYDSIADDIEEQIEA